MPVRTIEPPPTIGAKAIVPLPPWMLNDSSGIVKIPEIPDWLPVPTIVSAPDGPTIVPLNANAIEGASSSGPPPN
jgi:hypothetical protein